MCSQEHTVDSSKFVSNNEYMPSDLIAFLVGHPPSMDPMLLLMLKSVIEDHPKVITGLVTGHFVHEGTLLNRTCAVEFVWAEKYGRSIESALEKFLRDHVLKAGFNQPAIHTEAVEGLSILFVEPDATHTKVVRAWLGKGLWPANTGSESVYRDLNAQRDPSILTIPWSGNFIYNTKEVRAMAEEKLRILTAGSSEDQAVNDRIAEAYHTDIAEESALASRSVLTATLDPNDPDPMATIRVLLKDRESKNQGVGPEFQIIKAAVHEDPDYAWSWQCNLACCAMDEGVEHLAANRIAARFMRLLFDLDITSYERYIQLCVPVEPVAIAPDQLSAMTASAQPVDIHQEYLRSVGVYLASAAHIEEEKFLLIDLVKSTAQSRHLSIDFSGPAWNKVSTFEQPNTPHGRDTIYKTLKEIILKDRHNWGKDGNYLNQISIDQLAIGNILVVVTHLNYTSVEATVKPVLHHQV